MQIHAANDTGPVNTMDQAVLDVADASDDAVGNRLDRRVLAALFTAIAILMGTDLVLDCIAGADHGHVLFEGVILAVAGAGLAFLWRRIAAAWLVAGTLKQSLARARSDAAKWRAESQGLLAGLGAAIDRQFADWGLSPAEREVGLLLLKGMSLKEIAGIRGTSERTVRQQSLALYRKAGIAGRAQLSAFFLEDLLLPGPS